ncbi:MAG: condensation domain-containing protein [Cyanobacteria bacterium P01_H01_bin.35]
MENLSRKLGLVENVLDVLHNLGGIVCISVTKIEGLIQPGILQEALNLLQKRHPLLQVHIVELEDGKYFQSEDTKEIPLKVIKKHQSNQWSKVAEDELHEKFIGNTNPLCRVTLLDGSETDKVNEIITTYHHVIIDGHSTINFIQELLSYYTKIADGDDITHPIKMQFLSPLEEIIDRSLTNKNKIQDTQKNLAPQLPKLELLIEQEADPIDRRSHILTRIINPEITLALIESCKKEQTTIHSALSAAMLFAAGKHTFTNTPIKVSCALNVNIRKYCLPKVESEQIGCFVSQIQHNYILEANSEFWSVARECKSRIFQSIRLRTPLNSFSIKDLKYMNENEDVMIQGAKNQMGRKNTLDISNIGKLNLEAQYGQLKLKELYFTAGQHFIGSSLWLGVLIFEQQIFLTFTYVTPLLSEKTAQLLVDSVIDNIEKACSSESLSLS